MADHRVAHSVAQMLVTLADREEVSLAELCKGLPIDERTLRRRLSGLEWELFVELIERLEARLGRARLLGHSAVVPDISFIGRRLLGRFVSSRALLRFVCRVMGPSMYPMYATTYDEERQDDGTLVAHLTLRLADGLRGCRTIFDLNGVATAALPLFIDEAPFPLRTVTTARGGDYWFTLKG